MMLLRQYEGKTWRFAAIARKIHGRFRIAERSSLAGIAEYTGETLTLGQNGFCAMERK